MAGRRTEPNETVVNVETEKVDGTIHLSEIVERLEANLGAEAKKAKPDAAKRLKNATRLAAELKKELVEVEPLQTITPVTPVRPRRPSS